MPARSLLLTNIIEHLTRQSKSFLMMLALALVGLMGGLDYVTGAELSFSVFYLLPIVLVAWFVGRRAAVLISIVSAVFWFADDAMAARSYSHPAIPYWNGTVEFGFFLIVTYVLSALKGALERQKEIEQERIEREIEIAKEVQGRLFPQTLPPMKTLDYTGVCLAARGVSGDYYDFLRVAPNKLGIGVGDIAGKGISAALLMASLQALLRSQTPLFGDALDELFSNINRLMHTWIDGGRFATFFFGLYDDSQRSLTYVNAGHNAPILLRPIGPVAAHTSKLPDVDACEQRRLTTGGLIIGPFPHAAYEKETVQMQSGDVLLMFTDGLTEAANDMQEEFGEERLVALVAAHLDLSAAALRDLILAEIASFVGTTPLRDDLTLVVAKTI